MVHAEMQRRREEKEVRYANLAVTWPSLARRPQVIANSQLVKRLESICPQTDSSARYCQLAGSFKNFDIEAYFRSETKEPLFCFVCSPFDDLF